MKMLLLRIHEKNEVSTDLSINEKKNTEITHL